MLSIKSCVLRMYNLVFILISIIEGMNGYLGNLPTATFVLPIRCVKICLATGTFGQFSNFFMLPARTSDI